MGRSLKKRPFRKRQAAQSHRRDECEKRKESHQDMVKTINHIPTDGGTYHSSARR